MCMAYFSCNPSSPLPPLFSQKHTYIIPLLSPYVSCYYVHILLIMYIILRLYYLSEMPPSNITGFMKTVPAVYTLAQQYMQVRERTVSKKHSVCFPPFSILTQSYYYVHIPPPPPTLSCYYVQFLGANAPLGPASSEALYVCMSVCLYVCNILTKLTKKK